MKDLLLAAIFSIQFAAQANPVEGKFIAHEWGTFTAVQGSNGVPLGGMSHEEESLPSSALCQRRTRVAQDRRCFRLWLRPP